MCDTNGLNTLFFVFHIPDPQSFDGRTLDKYKKIKNLLTTKYGAPNKDVYHFEGLDPSEYEAAINTGIGTVYSYWNFKDGNYIKLMITKKLELTLLYQNQNMYKKMKAVQNAKQSGGY